MITYMQNVSVLHQQIAQKFNYRCIICFRRYSALHEIIPKSLGGKVSEENSVTLCQDCHHRIHDSGAVNWIEYLTDLRIRRLEEFANR